MPAQKGKDLLLKAADAGGSFFTLRLSNPSEAESLLSPAAYSQQIGA